MKWTARILIMLLLIGCTAVGCTVQETGQTQEQTLPQVQNPESTETGEPERETQTSETEPEDPYTPPVYVPAVICTDVHSGETAELSILYHERPSYTFNFTKVFSQGGAEDRLSAVGAVVFDRYDDGAWHWYGTYAFSSKEERLRADTVQYDRIRSDSCLYPADGELLDGEGGAFSSCGAELTLDAQTALTGTTLSGERFCVYTSPFAFLSTGESGTEYHVFYEMYGGTMTYFTLYTYEFDHPDCYSEILLPMISSARTWTAEMGAFPVAQELNAVFSGEDMEEWLMRFELPDVWLWENHSVISDAPRMLSGRYATKRMEFYHFSDRPWNEPAPDAEGPSYTAQYAEEARGTLESGIDYILYRRESVSEGEQIGVTWYICEYLLPARESDPNSTWRYRIAYLTFEDDPDGYFDEVIRPVMNSVRFYKISEK